MSVTRGTRRSRSPRRSGTSMQMGSPGSKTTAWPGRVSIQFIVKVALAQSVSTSPSSATTPSLGQLVGPRAIRFQPGSVRKSQGSCQVRIPLPKCDRAGGSVVPPRVSTTTESMCGPPCQVARTPYLVVTNHPDWLAIRSGRHRFAKRLGVASIQARRTGAGARSIVWPLTRLAVSLGARGMTAGPSTADDRRQLAIALGPVLGDDLLGQRVRLLLQARWGQRRTRRQL